MAETVKLVKSTHSPQQNHLLAALPAEIFERISPDLELVAMPLFASLSPFEGEEQDKLALMRRRGRRVGSKLTNYYR